MKQDSNFRSIAKTVSWRVLATTATAILVVVFTGNWQAAFVIGGSEVIAKMFLYFFHERIWNRVRWGKVTSAPKIIAVIEGKGGEQESIVPELKKLLLKLQKPTVLFDSAEPDTSHQLLLKKWIEELAVHSIHPIFVFQEWNHKIKNFLSHLGHDVVIINRASAQLGQDVSFRVWDHDSSRPLNRRILETQLGNL